MRSFAFETRPPTVHCWLEHADADISTGPLELVVSEAEPIDVDDDTAVLRAPLFTLVIDAVRAQASGHKSGPDHTIHPKDYASHNHDIEVVQMQLRRIADGLELEKLYPVKAHG